MDKIVYDFQKSVDNFWKADVLELVRLLKVVDTKKNKS